MAASTSAARNPLARLLPLLDPELRDRMVEDVAHGRALGAHAGALLAATIGGGALYGAVLGSWRGEWLTLYAAVKLPLVLLATAALTTAFNTVATRALGAQVGPGQCAVLALHAMAVAALILGAVAPVSLLFTHDAAPASRTAHNLLYLLHTAVVGASGLGGVKALRKALARVSPTPAVARRVHLAWVLLFALVGGEVAWVLRPFVGSIYEPVAFVRRNALDGNVYEFIVTDILPYLLSRD